MTDLTFKVSIDHCEYEVEVEKLLIVYSGDSPDVTKDYVDDFVITGVDGHYDDWSIGVFRSLVNTELDNFKSAILKELNRKE